MHLPCLFPLRCVELFVAVAAVSVAELFAAVAAGDTVAVLPFGPLFRRAAVAVPELFAAAAAGDTVVVLLFSSFILLSVAGACSCNVVVLLSSFFPQVIGLRQ